MVGLSLLVLALIVAARAALQRQNVAGLLLGCAATAMLTGWIFDLLSVFQLMPDRHLRRAAVLLGAAGRDRRRADLAVRIRRSTRSTALPAGW